MFRGSAQAARFEKRLKRKEPRLLQLSLSSSLCLSLSLSLSLSLGLSLSLSLSCPVVSSLSDSVGSYRLLKRMKNIIINQWVFL